MNLKLIEEQNTRNLKDFLTLYNKLTEQCFDRCVTRLYSKNLTNEEKACVETCTDKYVTFNQKIMQNFMEQQQARQEALATQMAQSQQTNTQMAHSQQTNTQIAQGYQTQVVDTGQKM